jgi:hypothetical protein
LRLFESAVRCFDWQVNAQLARDSDLALFRLVSKLSVVAYHSNQIPAIALYVFYRLFDLHGSTPCPKPFHSYHPWLPFVTAGCYKPGKRQYMWPEAGFAANG